MIEIIEYQKSWPIEFKDIGNALRNRLGNLALRIDHIGSTSVPGLAAKDIIDIQVTAAVLDDTVNKAMISMGYTRLEGIVRDHYPPLVTGTEEEWLKWFFNPPERQ